MAGVAAAKTGIAGGNSLVVVLEEDRLATALQELLETAGCLLRHVLFWRTRAQQLDHLLHRSLHALAHQGKEQFVLALEVPVEGALGKARLGENGVDGRPAIATFAEYPSSGVEDQLASTLRSFDLPPRPPRRAPGSPGVDSHDPARIIDQPVGLYQRSRGVVMSAEVATTQPATKLHPFALALSARDLGAMRE